MKVFAVSDLHLSGDSPKPMDIFGSGWENHWDKIREDWRNKVDDCDVVLIGGDISWAMTLEQAVVDLSEIEELPGRKVLLRGNHDFWWSSLTKVGTVLGPKTALLQNNCLRYGNLLVAGSRGWLVPTEGAGGQDVKIYEREVQRLSLSLDAAEKMRRDGDTLVVLTHFPPFNERREPSEVTALIEKHAPGMVLYGHLHGHFQKIGFDGELNGIPYRLTSCDHLGFALLPLFEIE